jgi:hypothetical protein
MLRCLLHHDSTFQLPHVLCLYVHDVIFIAANERTMDRLVEWKTEGLPCELNWVTDIMLCSQLKVNRLFGGTCRFHLQGRRRSQTRNQS